MHSTSAGGTWNCTEKQTKVKEPKKVSHNTSELRHYFIDPYSKGNYGMAGLCRLTPGMKLQRESGPGVSSLLPPNAETFDSKLFFTFLF